jgi:hypothetical protein
VIPERIHSSLKDQQTTEKSQKKINFKPVKFPSELSRQIHEEFTPLAQLNFPADSVSSFEHRVLPAHVRAAYIVQGSSHVPIPEIFSHSHNSDNKTPHIKPLPIATRLDQQTPPWTWRCCGTLAEKGNMSLKQSNPGT